MASQEDQAFLTYGFNFNHSGTFANGCNDTRGRSCGSSSSGGTFHDGVYYLGTLAINFDSAACRGCSSSSSSSSSSDSGSTSGGN